MDMIDNIWFGFIFIYVWLGYNILMKEGNCFCLNKLEICILICLNKNVYNFILVDGRWFLFCVCIFIKFLNIYFYFM